MYGFCPMGKANQCLLALTANNAYHEEYTIIRLSATHWLGNLRCAETTSCILLRELSSIVCAGLLFSVCIACQIDEKLFGDDANALTSCPLTALLND